MDTLIFRNQVYEALSRPSLCLQFPSLSNCAWDTTFSCTQRELDEKRSYGLLVLSVFLERACKRTAEQLENRTVCLQLN